MREQRSELPRLESLYKSNVLAFAVQIAADLRVAETFGKCLSLRCPDRRNER